MYVFHRAGRSISGENFGKDIISVNLLMVKYIVKTKTWITWIILLGFTLVS